MSCMKEFKAAISSGLDILEVPFKKLSEPLTFPLFEEGASHTMTLTSFSWFLNDYDELFSFNLKGFCNLKEGLHLACNLSLEKLWKFLILCFCWLLVPLSTSILFLCTVFTAVFVPLLMPLLKNLSLEVIIEKPDRFCSDLFYVKHFYSGF